MDDVVTRRIADCAVDEQGQAELWAEAAGRLSRLATSPSHAELVRRRVA